LALAGTRFLCGTPRTDQEPSGSRYRDPAVGPGYPGAHPSETAEARGNSRDVVQAARMESWHDFVIAEVGASAALVGLLFVALSLNVSQILKYSWLPARGAQTLVVLTGTLLEASLPLFPGGASRPVACASSAVSVLTWLCSLALVVSFVRGLSAQNEIAVPRAWSSQYVITAQVATLPAIAGSAFLISGDLAGYYWIAAGLLFTLVFALYNAWVLLIEILR
jgi:hypothetical protein